MTTYGPRVLPDSPRLVGRSFNDSAQEIQEFLELLKNLSDVTNIIISQMTVQEGGGTVTVTLPGGNGKSMAYFLSGA